MAGTWKILAHTKLTSANATIDTGDWTSGGTVTNPDTLKVIIYTLSANNDHYCYIRYNGDSGSNYVYRKNSEGEIPDGNPNTNMIYNDVYVHTRNSFVTMHIKNKSDKEKIAVMHNTGSSSGNSNYPARREYVSKWVDKTQQIKRITVHQGNGSNTFDANSYITVWGSVDDGTEDEKQTLADATRTESVPVTLSDDFSSDNFTNVGGQSGWGVSGGTMAWTTHRSTTHQGEYRALPSTVTGDFVLRFKLTNTTIAYDSSQEEYLYIGLSNSNSCASNTNQNVAGMYFHNYSSSDSKIQVTYRTNTSPFSGTATSIDFGENTTYYVEISKSDDTVTLKLFSDEDYSTLMSGGTATSTSGGASDQYTHIVLMGMYHSNAGSTSALGTIDDIKFYNGVSSASDTTVSTAPNAGTQYRETDTRKIYRRVAEGTFTSTDYTTSNFTAVGSTVAITSNSAVSTSTPSNTANRVYATIPSLKSTDAWSCDFQLYATADATNDYHTIAFCTNSDAFNTSGQNHISVQTQGGGYQRFVLNARIGGSNSEIATSSNTRSLNTNYYCTLSSDGAGTARMRIWTNSGRTGTPAQDKTLSIANIGTLTTVMHGARNSGDSNVWSGTVSNVSLTNPAKWVERGSA